MKRTVYDKGKPPFTEAELGVISGETIGMAAQIALLDKYDDLRTRLHDVRGRFRMLFEKHGRQCPDDILATTFPAICLACFTKDALDALAASDVDKAKAVLQEALGYFESVVAPTLPTAPRAMMPPSTE